MRVVAGTYRSRPLRSMRGLEIRPTTDKLRETLFNILSAGQPAALAGTVWLDLFAGTGAVGIEAISRGARQVYFVEVSRKAAALVRDNLRSLGIADGFELLERDVAPALRMLDSQAITCDFCFLDPPYRMKTAYEETLGLLSQLQLLTPTSIAIAEHDKKYDPGERFGALQRFRKLEQGDAALSFYRLG